MYLILCQTCSWARDAHSPGELSFEVLLTVAVSLLLQAISSEQPSLNSDPPFAFP